MGKHIFLSDSEYFWQARQKFWGGDLRIKSSSDSFANNSFFYNCKMKDKTLSGPIKGQEKLTWLSLMVVFGLGMT